MIRYNTMRSSPAFAVGSTALVNAFGRSSMLSERPISGWTCFHCGETMFSFDDALNHFGSPAERLEARCKRQYVERGEIPHIGV